LPGKCDPFLRGELKLASRTAQTGFANFEWAFNPGNSECFAKAPCRLNETFFGIGRSRLVSKIRYICKTRTIGLHGKHKAARPGEIEPLQFKPNPEE
jgi:hypothetical protein